MGLFFWIFWILDALLLALSVLGGGFKSSFGASSDLNTWVTILMFLVLILSLVLRFVFKLRLPSVLVAALPLLVMFVAYLVDKSKQTRA
jgi:hypothetical protein